MGDIEEGNRDWSAGFQSTTEKLACGHRLEGDKIVSYWISGERDFQNERAIIAKVLSQDCAGYIWRTVRRQCCWIRVNKEESFKI